MIHAHLAGDAEVEESAMLEQRTTGALREVDVVLRSRVGPHDVAVSIEARATRRKADLPWVESMIAKHEDLPTSQLVLVSESGFTGPAERHAMAKGTVPVSPKDLSGDHPGARLLDDLRKLDTQEVTLQLGPEVVLEARRPNGAKVKVWVPVNVNVYAADGTYLMMVHQLFDAERNANPTAFDTPMGTSRLQAAMDRRGHCRLGSPRMRSTRSRRKAARPSCS